MAELNTDVNQHKPFSGMRVLIAVAIGAGLGLAVAYFLKVLIDNSPAEIAGPFASLLSDGDYVGRPRGLCD